MKDIYFARQPIYNRDFQVEGYELFYRQAGADSAQFLDAEIATTQVVLDTVTEVGLDQIVGPHRAFKGRTAFPCICGSLALSLIHI